MKPTLDLDTPLSLGDSLDSRLKFSLNLDMLTVNNSPDPVIPIKKPRVSRRKSLRRLIHTVRKDPAPTAKPKLAPNPQGFQLELCTLPSLTSFSHLRWTDTVHMTSQNDDAIKEPKQKRDAVYIPVNEPLAAPSSTDDAVHIPADRPLTVTNNTDDSVCISTNGPLAVTNNTDDAVYTPTNEPPLALLTDTPVEPTRTPKRRILSMMTKKRPDTRPQISLPIHRWSTDNPPQRDRSLMFHPLLNVSEVGALIDTISSPQQQIDGNKEPAKKRPIRRGRILGSLRRAATAATQQPTRKAAPIKQKEADGKSLMTAPLKGLKDEPSLTICPIDTHEQYPPTGNFAPIAVSLKSSRQFLLNTPLGEFEVERTIGQGSYGKVKLMRSSLTNEQFAVKIIKRYTNKRERKARTLDRRVVREANLAMILGQLHPHIVPLHDFRATDTHFYLFYSFVDGVTLAERVGTKGLLEDDALAVFKPTAETIWFCHKYSIIHRDIKLENVLISAANGDVKLIDFGLANFFDGTSLMETFCGSLPYTAPEILRGDAYVGPEIDVWSLGVLLYVMLTGQFPFEDPAQTKNFDKIMRGDFRFPPGISCELSELLVMMLEPKPAKRISMQGVLEHPWLVHSDPPGVCCAQHPVPQINGTYDCTVLLPNPTIHKLVAQEVATCLDRSLAEVTEILNAAVAQGTPADYSGIIVPNSPVVSVYSLVLQQIGKRYYLDLPAVEPDLAWSTKSSQIFLQQKKNRPKTGKLSRLGNLVHRTNSIFASAPVLNNNASILLSTRLELNVRQIGALEELTRRILLPTELSARTPTNILGLLTTLLKMHEISFTFIETHVQRPEDPVLNNNNSSHLDVNVFSKSLIELKKIGLVHLKEPSRLTQMRPRKFRNNNKPADQPKMSVPVKHPTCVMLAQYSPSLNRQRETEVLEYYSCSVRLELVRITAIRLRYAILVDRTTGHKTKFSLFLVFLQRMVDMLPQLTPEPFEQT